VFIDAVFIDTAFAETVFAETAAAEAVAAPSAPNAASPTTASPDTAVRADLPDMTISPSPWAIESKLLAHGLDHQTQSDLPDLPRRVADDGKRPRGGR